MDYKIIVFPQAENDLAKAFSYLDEHSPNAASRWYRHLTDAINTLTELPERCAHAPETEKLGVEIRQLLYGQHPSVYRIVFRIVNENQEVHILTVSHSARKPLTEEEMELFLD